MMKKWTALLLALALCGSLAACVGGTQPAEDAAEDKETVETVKPEEETDNNTFPSVSVSQRSASR